MDTRPRIRTKHPGIYYREREDGSRQYLYWFEGTDGKGHFKNVPGGEREAKQARAKVVNSIAHGHKVAPSKALFADFIRGWLDEQTNIAPKTVESYHSAIENHLIPKIGPRTKLTDVDVNSVARFIAAMQKDGYKTNSIKIYLKPLSRSLATAARRGLITVNPVTQLERSERPKGDARKPVILDSDEIKLVLDNAGKHRTLLATLVFTGLRIGELLSLRWEDVDWSEGVIHVSGTKTKAAVREVVLMPALQQRLASLSLESGEGAIFEISRSNVRYALRGALKRAEIQKHIRVHDLRHTYASLLIAQGHDLNYIAGQMGHASATLTLGLYGHLIDRKKKRDEAKDRMEAQYGEVLS